MLGRKNIVFVSLGILLLASSCERESANDLIQTSSASIVFESPIVAPVTKAYTNNRKALYTNTFPTNWDFKLSAKAYPQGQNFAGTGWNNGQDWLSAVTFSCQNPAAALPLWTGSAYWPKSASLTLCASYPAGEGRIVSSGVAYGTAGQPYEISLDGTQNDLMYAERVADKTKEGDPVQMTFHHALASVVFTLRTDQEYEAVIKVKSIELKNIKYRGVFDQSLADNETGSGNPQWSGQTGSGNYNNIIKSSGIEVEYDYDPLQSGPQPLTLWDHADADDLLLLPQNFADAQIDIEYVISSSSSAEIVQTHSSRLADLVFDTAGVTGFEMGRKYIFNIIISRQKIRFAPQVGSWTPINVG